MLVSKTESVSCVRMFCEGRSEACVPLTGLATTDVLFPARRVGRSCTYRTARDFSRRLPVCVGAPSTLQRLLLQARLLAASEARELRILLLYNLLVFGVWPRIVLHAGQVLLV